MSKESQVFIMSTETPSLKALTEAYLALQSALREFKETRADCHQKKSHLDTFMAGKAPLGDSDQEERSNRANAFMSASIATDIRLLALEEAACYIRWAIHDCMETMGLQPGRTDQQKNELNNMSSRALSSLYINVIEATNALIKTEKLIAEDEPARKSRQPWLHANFDLEALASQFERANIALRGPTKDSDRERRIRVEAAAARLGFQFTMAGKAYEVKEIIACQQKNETVPHIRVYLNRDPAGITFPLPAEVSGFKVVAERG